MSSPIHLLHFNIRNHEQLEQTRTDLSTYAATQRAQLQSHNLTQHSALLEKLASTRHHLLGTKAIPGVFSRRLPYEVETNDESEEEKPPNERHLHLPTHLGPLIKVPESKLRNNAALRKWIRRTVGKNPKGIVVKPPWRDEGGVEEGKIVQGPFLVSLILAVGFTLIGNKPRVGFKTLKSSITTAYCSQPKEDLRKKKARPFRPTLRVQTDYQSVITAWREERLQEAGMRGKDPRDSCLHGLTGKYIPPGT